MKKQVIKVIALNSLSTATQNLRPPPRPSHGWLRAVREALGLPRSAVATKLKVSQAAVQDYEKSEAADTISLATLRRVAEALDCQLVVALVPRDGRTFQDLAAQHDPEIAHLRAVEHSMTLEAQGSGDLSRQITNRLS